VHRWTRDEYHAVALSGIFDDRRVELIDGEIVDMAPMLSPYATSIRKLSDVLGAILSGQDLIVGTQMPISLDQFNEPEPDLYVARREHDDYAERHPGPENLVLVVEVADSSLVEDCNRKVALYARAGIPEYWIVNLRSRSLEVYREPKTSGGQLGGYDYGLHIIVSETESSGMLLAQGQIRVADILPKVTP
jgi:Uma2 family endonuclease